MNKTVKRGIISLGLLATVSLGALPVFAGTSWINFNDDLPKYQGWVALKSDKKENSSKAEAKVDYIGSNYKANLAIYKGSNKVSSTYVGIDEGEKATFTVDSSAVGQSVTLKGQTNNWTIVRVEIRGKFRADS
ncbi:hypothetical protein [Paenibacillus sp. OSY-SE]|uniref:hypothetical protein n=1 Tax=Paenibacillus sp. OSY-SE TaxID=1196323 RepID=UPI00030207B2|nr:hypothetical protein [Paenibacillus sp. OSY-SE]